MDHTRKVIEAALFISGRWMSVEDLTRVAGSGSVGSVKEVLKELKAEYDGRDGGINMAEKDGTYRLEIAPETRDRVYYLAPEPELSPALIKTLALIAYKQPIYKSKVVDVIGNRAYEYMKELRKKEFIMVKKKGRGSLLLTTGHFRKYFGLPDGAQWKPDLGAEGKALEEAQKKLDEIVNSPAKEEMEGYVDRDAEFDEVEEADKTKEEQKEQQADKDKPEIQESEKDDSKEDLIERPAKVNAKRKKRGAKDETDQS